MADAQLATLNHLRNVVGVTTLVGDRLWVGRDEPPERYKPAQGPAVLIAQRGEQYTYDDDHQRASMQVQCIGRTELEAFQVYEAVRQGLHHQSSAYVKYGELEQGGTAGLRKPETGWPFVLAFFTVLVVAS